ncbi:MAG: CocE/NonD family hydrolase [Chloroflexota bacterium]
MFAQIKRFFLNRIAHQLGVEPPQHEVVVTTDIAIPMSDGVTLYANHYAPQDSGDFSTVLIRSPWGRGWRNLPFSFLYAYVAHRFAERGYHVILQDLRTGADKPETDAMPLENEQTDGRDTLRWLTQQSWFNGKLGLWGASILGYVQWAALAGGLPQGGTPIHTVAMVPATTATRWFSMVHPSGVLALDSLFRLQYTAAVAGLPFFKMMGAMMQQEKVMTEWLNHLPISEAMQSIPKVDGFAFERMMQLDDLNAPDWQKIDLKGSLQQHPAKVHLVAGWFDLFLPEQLDDYQTLYQAGKQPHLTIGPWHHLDQDLGSNAIRIGLTWFDTHLKGDSLAEKPVTVFVQGSDRWQELDEWPPQTDSQTLFLSQQNQLVATSPTYDEAADHYRYDPLDPTPSLGGAVINPKPGQQDNREIEARADVLIYETDVLDQDLEIIGTPTVTLFVTSSLQHTDFFVRICDVQPDGRSLNVTDNLVRLMLPENHQTGKQVTGKHEVEIRLWPTAYRFAKGHRIRVQIASGAHPRWNRNLGTGEPAFSGTAAKVAEQAITHGAAYPSRIVLPVYSLSNNQLRH